MSKAFLKSTNKARTEPLLSRVCIHLCWIAVSACVVDLPGRQPNWFSSRSGSNDGMSQSLTMPSSTLARVGRREIGRRSSWIEVGGWILGTGTTSADFQIRGTIPCLIETRPHAAQRPCVAWPAIGWKPCCAAEPWRTNSEASRPTLSTLVQSTVARLRLVSY